MKKNKPLLLVLAALSATAIGIGASGCGHEHTFETEWTVTETEHYYASTCGHDEKKDEGLHDTDGTDGACSVCGYLAAWKITYVSDHGTVPASLDKQKKLPDELPVLSDDGYDFGGWYLDADCTESKKAVAGAAITEATTLYAKWTKKVEIAVGETADKPVILQELGKQQLTTLINGKVYFKYTATAAGRYTVSGFALAEISAVTSDYDNANIVKDGGNYHLTLAAGKSVIITVVKGSSQVTDQVSAIVNECVNEPLPAEGWEAGRYSDLFDTLSIDFKRDGTLIFNGNEDSPCRYDYVGGDIDELTFEYSEAKYNVKYSVNSDNDKIISITFNGKDGKTTRVLVLEEEQTAIAIAKFSGKYEPAATDDKVAGIKLINIYEDGTGYLINNDDSKVKVDDTMASFYQKTNKLTWGNTCVITLNLNANNEVESITVATDAKSGTYAFKGASDVKPPESLPLPEGNAEYRGEKFSILTIGTRQEYKGYIPVDIVEYDGASLYTIKYSYSDVDGTVKSENYKVKVVKNGDAVSAIEFYALDGITKVDTLTLVNPALHDLSDITNIVEINTTDFEHGGYYFKATEAGTYKISAEAYDINYVPCDVALKYNVLAYDFEETGEDVPESGVIQLEAGAIVKVICEVDNAVINFSCQKLEQGMMESKPIIIENGLGEFVSPYGGQTYYFQYTAPKAGKYVVLCSYPSWDGSDIYSLHYNVNGTDCGYNGDTWMWYEGFSNNKPYYVVDVPADNLVVKINIILSYGSDSLKVQVSEAVTHTALSFDDENKGTLTAAGSYICENAEILESEAIETLVLTSSVSMTVTITATGEVKTGTEIALTKQEAGFGFTIEFTGTVNYSAIARLGSEANPYKITALGTTEVENDNTSNDLYVIITAPSDTNIAISLGGIESWGGGLEYLDFNYKLSDGTTGICYSKNSLSGSLSIAAGESVTIWISEVNTIPVIVLEDIAASATELEFVDGTPAEGKLNSVATAEVTGTQVYKIKDTNGVSVVVTASSAFSFDYGDGVAVNAAEDSGIYSLTIEAGKNVAFKITAEGTLTFTATYPQGHAKYPFDLTLVDGKFTAEIEKSTSYKFGSAGSYIIIDNNYNFTFTLNGKSVSSVIDVKAGDVLTASTYNGGEFSIIIAVPKAYKGKYTYGTEGELKIGNNTVTIGEKEYILTAISGDNYTFTYTPEGGAAETVTLTLNANEQKISSDVLKAKPMFTAAQAVEYTGTESSHGYTYTYTLLLNQDGTCTYAEEVTGYGKQSYDYEIEETASGYSFNYYTFTFDKDGNIVLTSSYGNPITLYAPGNEPAPTTSGLVFSGDGITITIPGGALGNFVNATYDFGDGPIEITIYENVGYYEYEGGNGFISGSFTVSEDGKTITLTEGETNYVLTKQESSAEPQENIVYSGDGVTLTIQGGEIADGTTAIYDWGDDQATVTLTETSTAGVYSFADGYNFTTGKITVSENTVELYDDYTQITYNLTKQS